MSNGTRDPNPQSAHAPDPVVPWPPQASVLPPQASWLGLGFTCVAMISSFLQQNCSSVVKLTSLSPPTSGISSVRRGCRNRSHGPSLGSFTWQEAWNSRPEQGAKCAIHSARGGLSSPLSAELRWASWPRGGLLSAVSLSCHHSRPLAGATTSLLVPSPEHISAQQGPLQDPGLHPLTDS